MSLAENIETPLALAIRIAGGQSAFGRIFDKRQSSVREWLLRNELPAELVILAEEATGVSRHDLRPDIYPRDDTPHVGDAAA